MDIVGAETGLIANNKSRIVSYFGREIDSNHTNLLRIEVILKCAWMVGQFWVIGEDHANLSIDIFYFEFLLRIF